ncbi:ribonuclease HII [Arthrobacter sp. NPDC057013]|uniref:ribonuclease HII n=1 Tax=Arthrobacter sp. NPDC057013 TaxID=3345999 RepID=UPI0036340B3F
MSVAPTLDYEKRFLPRGARFLAGVDEVGRGALAGPVSVGIAVVDLQKMELLADVRDSKLLKAADRERLDPLVRAWSVASAVGHASAREIDELGIMGALRTAGNRAWFKILGAGVTPDVVLLDGSHNWLSPVAQPSLFDEVITDPGCDAPVHTLVKADMQCLSVAAASVLAKVERDQHMRELHLECPDFGWDVNKGYATAAHREAIRTHGPSLYHRVSWNLLSE